MVISNEVKNAIAAAVEAMKLELKNEYEAMNKALEDKIKKIEEENESPIKRITF